MFASTSTARMSTASLARTGSGDEQLLVGEVARDHRARRLDRLLCPQRRVIGREPEHHEDHDEDGQASECQQQLFPVPGGCGGPRSMRMRLSCHMVPIEVARTKTQGMEPVLLTMPVGGHGLTVSSLRLERSSIAL